MKAHLIRLFLLCCLCFLAFDTVAEKSITLSCTVLNHAGQPLAGSTVSISGLTTNTDAQGAFSFPGLERQNLLLTISHVDYRDEIITVQLTLFALTEPTFPHETILEYFTYLGQPLLI